MASDPFETLASVAAVVPASEWMLVGGLMVHCHAQREQVSHARPTHDADLVVEIQASSYPKVAHAVQQLGFQLHELGRPGDGGGSDLSEGWRHARPEEVSRWEMRERAVRMVREKMAETPRLSQNRACIEVGEQLGIKGDTLRNWVKVVRVDDGELPGTTSADAKRPAELEKENRELRRANTILRQASAYFAQAELDRR